MIKQTTIDAIKALDIIEIIGKHVTLKKVGNNYKCKSPFTDEKTPSFTVSPAKQIFKCFSSGHGGDGISFVMQHSTCSYYEALKQLAQDHTITIEYENETPESKKAYQEKQDRDKILLNLNRAASRQYVKQLMGVEGNHPACVELIDKRLYTDETINQWQIGYAPGTSNGFAPKEWQFLTAPIIEKGLLEVAKAIGLVNSKNGSNYDVFRNRLMFPIHDHNSRLVGFGGRALDAKEAKKFKYTNTAETELYTKNATLYGLNFAIPSIRKKGFAYLTEGYTDVISFHQANIDNTVASCGTGLTVQQVQLLKRYTTTVVIAYDADEKGAGQKAAIKGLELFLKNGFYVYIVDFPLGVDPDQFVRDTPVATEEVLDKLHVDGIEYKANYLLEGATSIQRDTIFNDLARNLASIEKPVIQSDIGKAITKAHGFDWSSFKQMVSAQIEINKKKDILNNVVRKNKVVNLNSESHVYPFFEEKLTPKGDFKSIEINRFKLIQLLKSFGYYRYEVVEDSSYTFVQIKDNLIKTVQRDNIIDHIERFIQKDYDFDEAGCEYTNAEALINKFYAALGSYFSKDLFARLKTDEPIIINKDTKDEIFFYYKNGFVKITAKGRELLSYDKMNGSIWDQQTLPRTYTPLPQIDPNKEIKELKTLGMMGDFVSKISGSDPQRFESLCSIIGYLVHDYYDYKLKTPLFTDSTISDKSDGRTGKTLLLRLIGKVRSYIEINGKDFDANDKKKYQDVKIDTQLIHLNDIKHVGRNKFNFEDIFNDITEGYIVDGKWMMPYRKLTKYTISSNRTVNIQGSSQIDRVIEYEVSNFFNINHTPEQEYGMWLMRDWDTEEWNRYDNFMCYCAQIFLMKGIIKPDSINLELRKLTDHTANEFLQFMTEIKRGIEKDGQPFSGYWKDTGKPIGYEEIMVFTEFIFDKNKLYTRFIQEFSDFDNKYFTQRKFTSWLEMYAEKTSDLQLKYVKQWRANGYGYIQFIEDK